MTLGESIRTRRKELGLSVDELAEKVGKNRAAIYRYENDEIEMHVSLLRLMADALDTVPDLLMDWKAFLREVSEDSLQMRKILPLLENGVSVKSTDHSYIILKVPSHGGHLQHDFCFLLSGLYDLNAANCGTEVHSIRILIEIAATLDEKFLDNLVSYAEFLDVKNQEKIGEPFTHPYQLEQSAEYQGEKEEPNGQHHKDG